MHHAQHGMCIFWRTQHRGFGSQIGPTCTSGYTCTVPVPFTLGNRVTVEHNFELGLSSVITLYMMYSLYIHVRGCNYIAWFTCNLQYIGITTIPRILMIQMDQLLTRYTKQITLHGVQLPMFNNVVILPSFCVWLYIVCFMFGLGL